MLLVLEGLFSYVYYAVMWRTFKWLMRLFTGQCELLRITLSEHDQLQRTRRIENNIEIRLLRSCDKKEGLGKDIILCMGCGSCEGASEEERLWKSLGCRIDLTALEASLTHSRSDIIRQTLKPDGDVDILATIDAIINLKRVKIEQYPEFSQRLQNSVDQIVGYRRLTRDIETLRRTLYSCDNPDHESQLLELWHALRPDTPLESRVGRQWSEIGFQGDDPATDFRGMGLLGLSNLLFLATQYNDVAKQLMVHSEHPQFGYSFAIAGINITSVGWKLLMDGRLKSHFYHARSIPQMEDFHLVYVYLFYEFDKFWLSERPADIMQFNVVKNKFVEEITRRLESMTGPLKLNLNSNSRMSSDSIE